jgi:Multiubiquitin
MQTQHEVIEHPGHHPPPHVDEIEIHVNERPVHLTGHRHTGLEIKQAAIAQHVRIEPDFLLYLEGPEGQTKHIDDAEEVTITDKTHFAAVPDDDNS